MGYEINEIELEAFNSHIVEKTVFDTGYFNLLNSNKCKELFFYEIKCDDKLKFIFSLGLGFDNVINMPFSAPFYFFPCVKNLKMYDYHASISLMIDFIKTEFQITEINITLPPNFYSETHITNIQNALFNNGFVVKQIDVNFHYVLSNFSNQYIDQLDIKAKQKLKSAMKQNLSFSKCQTEKDLMDAYEIIRLNRQSKGYPLRMSFEDILKTKEIVDIDGFIVTTEGNLQIAAALVFNVAADIVLVVYWGNIPETESYKPMNYIAYKVFDYYKCQGKTIVDIGPSTSESAPNFGLCDFKQSIGCCNTPKYTFTKKYFEE